MILYPEKTLADELAWPVGFSYVYAQNSTMCIAQDISVRMHSNNEDQKD
jgi:hypothetical protein